MPPSAETDAPNASTTKPAVETGSAAGFESSSPWSSDGAGWGALACALTFCVLVNNLCWTWASEVRFVFDFSVHARAALLQHDNLVAGRLSSLLTLPGYTHGPGTYLAAALSTAAFGLSLKNVVMSSSVWIPVYGIAIYGIGKCLFDARAGFWATVYFFSIPEFVDFSKQFPGEIVSHALVMLALMLLLQSDLLRHRALSMAFGAALAASLYTKSEVPAIWFAPLTFLGLRLVLDHLRAMRARLGFAALLSALCWGLHAVCAPTQEGLRAWLAEEAHYRTFAALDATVLAIFILLIWRHRPPRTLNAVESASPSDDTGGEAADRFWNLVIVGAMLVAALLPLAVGRNLVGVFEERLFTATEGSWHGNRWIDPLYYARVMGGRLFGVFYCLLAGVGVACAVATGALRDRKRLLFFSMFAYVFVLVNVVAGKFEIYLFNILGFTAIAATWWPSRFRLTRRVVPALLAVYAWLQIFGWLLLPARTSDTPVRLAPFTVFENVAPLAPGAGSGPICVTPILPAPPSHRREAFVEMMAQMCQAVKQKAWFFVGLTPHSYVAYHHDGFGTVAGFTDLPIAIVPLNAPQGTATLPPYTPWPAFFVGLQGDYPITGSEKLALKYFDDAVGKHPPVRLQLFAAWAFTPDFRMLIYRVWPQSATPQADDGGATTSEASPSP